MILDKQKQLSKESFPQAKLVLSIPKDAPDYIGMVVAYQLFTRRRELRYSYYEKDF